MTKTYCFQNISFNKRSLTELTSQYYIQYGIAGATCLLDSLKDLGFYFATKASISMAIEDLKVPPFKKVRIEKTNRQITITNLKNVKGVINEVERFQKVIDMWNQTSEDLKKEVVNHFKTTDSLNPIYMMAFSGARGNLSQVHQLVGMRGLMADPNGEIIDLPIEANFREGLKVTDYIISSYGARKGIVDTALRTADSGYLTRRLVDVAQHVIIREIDCGTKTGIKVKDSRFQSSKLVGRILVKDIKNNKNKIIVQKNQEITLPVINSLTTESIFDLIIRSPLTCTSSRSVCQKCYGWNLSQTNLVEIGEAIGVIAAQSIGEPGTQLTMRTFHTGGVFTNESKRQIRNKTVGKILFSPLLKTRINRTIYGEETLLVDNNSQIYLVNNGVTKFKVIPNMLLFINNTKIVQTNSLIAELPTLNNQFISAEKNIKSDLSGEIKYENIRIRFLFNNSFINSARPVKVKKDGIIWIMVGNIVSIPENSLINIKNNSYILKNENIFSLKIRSKQEGLIKIKNKTYLNNKQFSNVLLLTCQLIFQFTLIFENQQSKFKRLYLITKNSLLFQLIYSTQTDSLNNTQFAKRITYNYALKNEGKTFFSNLNFISKTCKNNLIQKRGGKILVLPFEHYIINRDSNITLFKNNTYINSGSEIIKNLYSKNDGLLELIESDNILKDIFIKYGQIKNFLHQLPIFLDQNVCVYPGEILFKKINIYLLSKCSLLPTIDRKNKTTSLCKIFYQPIIQCALPKKLSYKKQLIAFNKKTDIAITNKIEIHLQHNNIYYFQTPNKFNTIQSFVYINLNTNKFGKNLTLSYFKNPFNNNLINIYCITKDTVFFINTVSEELKKSNPNTIVTVKNDQYIEPYSVIAFINFLTNKTLQISYIKSNLNIKNKILYVIEKFYLWPSKTLTTNKLCEIGYQKIEKFGQKNNQIINEEILADRIGQPYFISNGTIMYVNHGDFIQKNKLLCLLVYNKTISGDIIQGLPKIEQILESRISKTVVTLAIKPSIIIKYDNEQNLICLEREQITSQIIDNFQKDVLKQGSIISVGQPLDTGIPHPHQILNAYFKYYKDLFSMSEATFRSLVNVQIIVVNSIQSVYKSQGINISDKHIEIIVKQMGSKIQIQTATCFSKLLPGEIIDFQQIKYINTALQLEQKPLISYRPIVLGITRTSLLTESFISAASFQETTKVLARAAIEGKIEWLRGLKENVVMGKLIPAGTGLAVFNNFDNLKLRNS